MLSTDNEIKFVDTAYKLRKIDDSLVGYHTIAPSGKKTNEIKYMKISNSDYQVFKVYEELDGTLVEFLVQTN